MNISEISELIKNRRSIFPPSYNGTPVSKEFVELLLENANWAPTHKKTEPWRFKVVYGESIEKLGTYLSDTYTDITPDDKFSPFKHKKIQDNCKAASCIIAICMQRDEKEHLPEWEEVAATAMAVQNMWLTCTAAQVGCYWSSPAMINYMNDFFDMEDGERCLGFFYIGNYNNEDEFVSKRGSIKEKTVWI